MPGKNLSGDGFCELEPGSGKKVVVARTKEIKHTSDLQARRS
jgi:hypothetical protein